jgi:hypothetical protein
MNKMNVEEEASALHNDVLIRNIHAVSNNSVEEKFSDFLKTMMAPHNVQVHHLKIPRKQSLYNETVYGYAGFVSPIYEYDVLKKIVIEELNMTQYEGRNLIAEDARERHSYLESMKGSVPKDMVSTDTQTATPFIKKVTFSSFSNILFFFNIYFLSYQGN